MEDQNQPESVSLLMEYDFPCCSPIEIEESIAVIANQGSLYLYKEDTQNKVTV